jgi:hypothetical protein
VTPDTLRRAAELLVGPDPGAREMGRLLGPAHPDGPKDELDPRLMRRWLSGSRAIPGWVVIELERRLNAEADRLRAESEAARSLAKELAAEAFEASTDFDGTRDPPED